MDHILFFFAENLAEWLSIQGSEQPTLKRILEDELNNGEDVNQKTSLHLGGWPLLTVAANRGFDEIVEFLLQKGANINAKDKNGYTALIRAVCHNQLKCVEVLLENEADATVKCYHTALTLSYGIYPDSTSIFEALIPFTDVEDRLKNEETIREVVEQHLTRLQAVKESLKYVFHEQLLEGVCDFLVSEEKLKAWLS